MAGNPPLEGLLGAMRATGDARLLAPALDLCVEAADFEAVLALAEEFDAALDVQVRALIALKQFDAAEARYRSAVAANPAVEEPALLETIAAARAEHNAPSNIVALSRGCRGDHASAAPEEDEVRSANLSFTESASRVSFDDVGGHDEVKRQIRRRIIAPFEKPTMFARFRRAAGGGVLLYGPPGCGKTLIARATAGECKARFINVPATDIVDKYIGEPERKLAAIFADARRETPTVLFFDEIEALAGKRGHQSTHHEIGMVSTFLTELDGFEKANDGVLILAATNMPWAVDAAFRRSGRFDRQLFVPPPDRAARLAILKMQIAGRPVADGLKLDAIAAQSSGFSGADIENLVNTAADIAIEESIDAGAERPIAQKHFEEALGEVRPTTAEWLTVARNFAKYGNTGGQYDEITDFLKKHGR